MCIISTLPSQTKFHQASLNSFLVISGSRFQPTEGQTDGQLCKPIVPFRVNMGRGLVSHSYMGLEARWFGNNKGADQHAHPCSLTSTLVICLLESVKPRLAMSENSIF